jgi:hypothetical protein
LIAGIPSASFAFEERKRVIVEGDRDLGLPDTPTCELIDRRQLVSDTMQVADDFPLVV